MLEIGRNFTEIKKLKNMNMNLTQSEMNELIYALGIAQMHGKMVRKDIAEQVSNKLYRALAVENVRLEKQLEQDNIVHDMNFKRRYIETGNY
jgi:hypothetical protein